MTGTMGSTGHGEPLGVALVGAGPDQWSGMAHIPAVTVSSDLDLRWLVTSQPESAAEAQRRWGVPATHELSRVLDDGRVDLVTVTVRVPHHAEVARAAIEAGKHVYCEWPLTTGPEEAGKLAALSARFPDRVHIAGLQGRYSPELQTAARMLIVGRIGRPLTANVRLFIPQGLLARPAHRAHLRHRSAAANVLTVQAGHTLDMLGQLLGSPRPLASRLWSAVGEFTVEGSGRKLPRDAPDNLAAILDYGGVITTTQFSQTSADSAFSLEVLGTEGVLRMNGAGQPQMSPLSLSIVPLGGAETSIPADSDTVIQAGLPIDTPGYNVSLAYSALLKAIRTSSRDARLPDFRQALRLHEDLASIEALGRGRDSL
jgi:predicted dehydrogenase